LAHRGPDGRGVATLDGCVLGSTRLAVVDPPGSDQPIEDLAAGTTVVCNGELYGYERLRRELDRPWRTAGDVEVLLALHERHGAELCPHVPGMFAFALWDARGRRLVVGRDRFGEKPLFWARGRDGQVVLASELKAVAASGLCALGLDREVLQQVLRQGWVPPDRTIHPEAHVVPPGHRLLVHDGGVQLDRWWDPPAAGSLDLEADEAAAELRRLLRQAVGRQL
ncbi:hypothetical protein B7486_70710, partial [cyanobacterium TDX16]